MTKRHQYTRLMIFKYTCFVHIRGINGSKTLTNEVNKAVIEHAVNEELFK